MTRHCARIKLVFALLFSSVILVAGSASAQSSASVPDNQQKDVATAEPKSKTPANKVSGAESRPKDLQSEVENLKAENAAVRELLRRMEEQQKTLLEQVDRLQRRLDGGTIANGQATEQPSGPAANVPLPATNAADATASAASAESAATPPAPAPIDRESGQTENR